MNFKKKLKNFIWIWTFFCPLFFCLLNGIAPWFSQKSQKEILNISIHQELNREKFDIIQALPLGNDIIVQQRTKENFNDGFKMPEVSDTVVNILSFVKI